MKNGFIYIMIVSIICTSIGYCKDSDNPNSDGSEPITGVKTSEAFNKVIKEALNDVSVGATQQLRSGTSTSQAQTPVSIDKHTQDFRTEYNKGENITIVLRILNGDLSNKIDDVTINEELPIGFGLVSPRSNTKLAAEQAYKLNNLDGVEILTWHTENLRFVKYINYTISSYKSGIKYFTNSWLVTSITDRTGVLHKITSVSNDLQLNIKNRDPIIENLSIENPIYIKKGDELSISANVIDPDNDNVSCFLIFDNQDRINAKEKGDDRTKFILNLSSKYTNKDHNFKLVATDNESTTQIGPFEIKTYYLTSWETHFSTSELQQIISELLRLFIELVILTLTLFGALNLKEIYESIKLSIGSDQESRTNEKIFKADKENKTGLKLHRLHKYKEAILAFNRAIEIDPTFAIALNNRGLTQYHLNKYDDAIDDFKKAIEIDIRFADANNNLGLALVGKETYEEAIAYYNRAIELNSQHAEAWFNKGKALSKLGKNKDADVAFAKAKELGCNG